MFYHSALSNKMHDLPFNFKIYPDVLKVIKDLHKKGYNLGIVTSKFRVAAWPSFSHYELEKYFQVFVALDNVDHPKPHRI